MTCVLSEMRTENCPLSSNVEVIGDCDRLVLGHGDGGDLIHVGSRKQLWRKVTDTKCRQFEMASLCKCKFLVNLWDFCIKSFKNILQFFMKGILVS